MPHFTFLESIMTKSELVGSITVRAISKFEIALSLASVGPEVMNYKTIFGYLSAKSLTSRKDRALLIIKEVPTRTSPATSLRSTELV